MNNSGCSMTSVGRGFSFSSSTLTFHVPFWPVGPAYPSSHVILALLWLMTGAWHSTLAIFWLWTDRYWSHGTQHFFSLCFECQRRKAFMRCDSVYWYLQAWRLQLCSHQMPICGQPPSPSSWTLRAANFYSALCRHFSLLWELLRIQGT